MRKNVGESPPLPTHTHRCAPIHTHTHFYGSPETLEEGLGFPLCIEEGFRSNFTWSANLPYCFFFSLHVNLFLSGIYLGRKSPLPFHQKKFSGGLWWMGITTDFTLIPLYEGLSLAKRVAWRTSLPVSYLLGLDCCEIKLNSHELIKKRVKWLLYLTSSCRVR